MAKASVTKQITPALRALGDGTLIDKLMKLDWEKIFAKISALLAGCAPVATPGKLRGLLKNPDKRSKKLLEREVRHGYLEAGHSSRDWKKDKEPAVAFAESQGKDKAMQDRLLTAAQALVDSGDIGEEA